MDWEKRLRKETEIKTLELIEKTLTRRLPIHDNQIKWNDFGVYIQNKKIQGIGFYSQQLELIPKELWSFQHLEVLNFVNNGITELSEEIGSFNSLKELYIGGNKLKSIPKSIGKLKNLVVLYLLEENLINIPDEIGNLIKLKELSMSGKNLDKLAESVINLKNKDCRIYLNNKEL
ncbi:MAG: leucine-rich repeat domain-containing protein [Candidatus Hodarchaeales archaeon]|jgi:Leucine-rich repeat (LRR) protein